MTPLYPRLRTNLPVPSMTYPGPSNTYPEGTPLYPPAHYVEEYYREFTRRQDLYSHIKLNHTVTSAQWVGNATVGYWGISFTAADTMAKYEYFDHLVVAAGFNHFPHTQSWPGQDSWLGHKKHRKITHSLWFHLPEEYKGLKVLVVGAGESGKDITTQLAAVCEVSP
jgi:cation diffusion facilitator CzcD-associated flavoprotein CzcO